MNDNYQKRGYLLEDFRLFHLRTPHGIRTDYHYHEFCKLLFLISGSGSYAVEGQRYHLLPGDIVTLNAGCVHRPELAQDTAYERLIIYISPDFLHTHSVPSYSLEQCFSDNHGHVLRLTDIRKKQLFDLADRLERELSSDHPGKEILCTSLLLQILVFSCRFRHPYSLPAPVRLLPSDPVIQAIVSYLDSCSAEQLSIDKLAEQFFLSKYYMMRRFREQTGTTIHAYLLERRLFLARELLSGGMPSVQVCFQVGFGSYSAFSRAYGSLFGMTPNGRPCKHARKADADGE